VIAPVLTLWIQDVEHCAQVLLEIVPSWLTGQRADELATISLDLWAGEHTISVYMENKKQILVPGARLAHCSHGSMTPQITFHVEVAA